MFYFSVRRLKTTATVSATTFSVAVIKQESIPMNLPKAPTNQKLLCLPRIKLQNLLQKLTLMFLRITLHKFRIYPTVQYPPLHRHHLLLYHPQKQCLQKLQNPLILPMLQILLLFTATLKSARTALLCLIRSLKDYRT